MHSGQRVSMSVMPGETDTGYCFVRKDVKHKNNEVYALWHNVCDTFPSTTISNSSGIRVSTVEHIVAALHACGVDNARIVLNGPEVPIVDGSALPFVQLIQATGLNKQDEDRFVYVLKKPVEIREDHRFIVLQPADSSDYSVSMDYSNQSVAQQSYSLSLSEHNFHREIAAARSLGLDEDIALFNDINTVHGGSLSHTIFAQQDNFLCEEGLRFSNEYVRHKLLTCIGDLALAGDPILARVDAHCSCHRLNNAALLKMMHSGDNYELMPLRMWHQRREDFRPVTSKKAPVRLYGFDQETARG